MWYKYIYILFIYIHTVTSNLIPSFWVCPRMLDGHFSGKMMINQHASFGEPWM